MNKLFIVLVLLSFFGLAWANGDAVEEGKKLVDSNASCDAITEHQLEEIGEYYMEQMHPGEAHEIMDNMMSGEGSDSLKQVHVNMARRLYCKENIYIGYGMMGSEGMMNMMDWNSPNLFGLNILDILLLVLLVGLIILVYLHIWNRLKETKKR